MMPSLKHPHMWDGYRDIAGRFQRITLDEERKLIAQAQHGSQESRDELVLRHLSFVMFRLQRTVRIPYLQRLGEDLLSAALPVLATKVDTYDLRYRDSDGRPKPVRFKSYIWKRVDGAIVDSLKGFLRAEAAERAIAEAAMPHGRRSGRFIHPASPAQESETCHEYAETCCA